MKSILSNHTTPTLLRLFSFIFIFMLFWNISIRSNAIVVSTMLPLLYFMKNPFPLPSRTLYVILGFFFVFTFMAILNILHNDISYPIFFDNFVKKLFFTNIVFVFIILFYKNREKLLIESVNLVLLLLVCLWFIQFIVFYTTNYYIDLLEPVTGVPQRFAAGYVQRLGLIRPTSLFNEPGTYAMAVLPLLILSYFANNNKIKLLHIFTLFSFFGSLSLFAIISASLFIFIVILLKFNFKFNVKNVLLLSIFFLLIYLLYIGLLHYIEIRSATPTGEISGAAQREHIFKYWLSLQTHEILFGQGFAQTKFENYVINDSGLAFKLLYEYGIFSILFFVFIFYLSWGIPSFFLLIILLTKISYINYIFLFYFSALYIISKKEA